MCARGFLLAPAGVDVLPSLMTIVIKGSAKTLWFGAGALACTSLVHEHVSHVCCKRAYVTKFVCRSVAI